MFNNLHSFNSKLSFISRLVVLSCTFLVLSGCSIFEQDAEDGRQPAVLKEINPQLKLQVLWKTSVGDAAEGLGFGLSPAVKDGVVFIAGHNGIVRALNSQTGAQVWSTPTGVSISAGPTVGVGRVVVGSNNGEVVALDADNGSELWRAQIAGEIISPAGVGIEHVAVRSANGSLNVLSASSGDLLWVDEQEVPRLSLRGSSTPLVTKGVVISASDSGKVSSYNAIDGGVVWERLLGLPRGTTELERLVDIDGNIGFNGDKLFVVGYNSRLAKIDARSGNILWAKEYSSSNGVGLGWKNVYASTTDAHVVALDQETGSQTWKSEEYQYRELTAPLAVGRAVVVGDFEGFVHFLSPQDGSTIARQRIAKSPIRVTTVFEDDTVFVQSDDGNVVAIKILGE